MNWTLQYYVEVERDLNEAIVWYQEQLDGLQIRFSAEVGGAVKRIQNNPLIYQIKYRNIRVAYLDVFPYAVHYYLDEVNHIITIIGILHQRINPQVPLKR